MSKNFGNSGKKKFPFNRNKLLAEPSSERGSHLLRQAGDEGSETRQKKKKKNATEDSQRLMMTQFTAEWCLNNLNPFI